MHSEGKSYKDQLGRQVEIPVYPKKIISLVPSQTEFLADLGLQPELAGITKFCVHPDAVFRSKPRVGGTKTFNFDAIRALRPDLIVCNKEENEKEQVEALMQEFPVWISDINTLDEAYEMMRSIGSITGKAEKAEEIILTIKRNFKTLIAPPSPPSAAYLIWREPYMAAGNTTIIDHLLEKAGFLNVFRTIARYPSVTTEMLQEANPRFVLLSSEPYPFREKHIKEIKAILPGSEVLLVDGELFSWYGSRLIKAPEYFKTLNKEIKVNKLV